MCKQIVTMCVAVVTMGVASACSQNIDSTAQKLPQASAAAAPSAKTGAETEVLPETHEGNDESIVTIGKSFYCHPDGGEVTLSLEGETQGFTGAIRVNPAAKDGMTYLKITWDNANNYHTLIINDDKWGYVNKDNLSAPATSRLPLAKWGQVKYVKVCGKRTQP